MNDPEDVDQRVLGWRLQTLLGLGVPLPLAEKLAAAPVDLHEYARLVARGCSVEIAAEILL